MERNSNEEILFDCDYYLLVTVIHVYITRSQDLPRKIRFSDGQFFLIEYYQFVQRIHTG